MEKIYIVKEYTRYANNGNDRFEGEWLFKNKENAVKFIENRKATAGENEYYKIDHAIFSDFEVEA